jgi:hypothetical protein
LTDVVSFVVTEDVVDFTERKLRENGAKGFELFVFWSGVVARGNRFLVQTAHVPRQTATRSSVGLLVRVEGDALHDLNVWLYEQQQILGVQVHAHPTDAYHSDTDDSFPIVTALGGLSLVVPDFCRHDLLSGSAAYRLTEHGWLESTRPPHELIEVA